MESEHKTAIVIVAIIGLVFAVLAYLGASYQGTKNKLIAEAIEKGADPIAVACAYDNLPANQQVLCAAVKGAKPQ